MSFSKSLKPKILNIYIVYDLFKILAQSQLLCKVRFYCDTFIIYFTYSKILNIIVKIIQSRFVTFSKSLKFKILNIYSI